VGERDDCAREAGTIHLLTNQLTPYLHTHAPTHTENPPHGLVPLVAYCRYEYPDQLKGGPAQFVTALSDAAVVYARWDVVKGLLSQKEQRRWKPGRRLDPIRVCVT
jgi:hypothetical protein